MAVDKNIIKLAAVVVVGSVAKTLFEDQGPRGPIGYTGAQGPQGPKGDSASAIDIPVGRTDG